MSAAGPVQFHGYEGEIPMSLDQRVDALEKQVAKLQSQIERALEGVAREVQKNRNRLDAQEAQRKANANDVNKITQKAHDHITKLEKQVSLLIKMSAKADSNQQDPRKQEKNIMKMVDSALAAYDKKKKR
jgi:TolA-binding protein